MASKTTPNKSAKATAAEVANKQRLDSLKKLINSLAMQGVTSNDTYRTALEIEELLTSEEKSILDVAEDNRGIETTGGFYAAHPETEGLLAIGLLKLDMTYLYVGRLTIHPIYMLVKFHHVQKEKVAKLRSEALAFLNVKH